MRAMFDGFISLVAAVLTACIGFVPAWFAHVAIGNGQGPLEVYVAIAALVIVTGVMVLAFLRKAGAGISPLRERKR